MLTPENGGKGCAFGMQGAVFCLVAWDKHGTRVSPYDMMPCGRE